MDTGGTVEPGFGSIADAFAANFEERGELGAAFCLYVDGRKVVDVWGGVADHHTGRPWTEDTLTLVFSTTKGVTAICANLLAQRGELDLGAPVARYWPEFAAAGKEAVTVEHLLCHRAGLAALDQRLPLEAALAWDPAAEALAAQAPLWDPQEGHGYHAVTFGWLVGEVIRRVAGRSVGRFVAEELAGPLGLDLWIGLPESEERRVSRLRAAAFPVPGSGSSPTGAMPPAAVERLQAMLDPESLMRRALGPTEPPLSFNSRAVHAAELPAANGIATARALAKLYAATIGEVGGRRLLSAATVEQACIEQAAGWDRVLLTKNRFGSGFFLDSPFQPLLGPRSFGHAGAGGSLAFADPDRQVGFAYVMNQMQEHLAADPRPAALMDACRSALDR